MPDENSPPPTPLLPVLIVILVVDAVVLFFLSSRGMLQRLSPGAQFFYGLSTFGFPVLVYVLLKQRRNRGD